MNELISLGVVFIAATALITPFVAVRAGILPFDPSDIELASGPRSFRTLFFAVVLLVGSIFGIYAEILQHKYSLAFFSVAIPVLMLAVILPRGRIRTVFVKALEYFLVAFAITIVVVGIAEFFVAAMHRRALLPRSRGSIWIGVEKEPFIFWYAIASTGIMVAGSLYFLKEYFLRVYESFWRRRRGYRWQRH